MNVIRTGRGKLFVQWEPDDGSEGFLAEVPGLLEVAMNQDVENIFTWQQFSPHREIVTGREYRFTIQASGEMMLQEYDPPG